jgi:hypothetical protein
MQDGDSFSIFVFIVRGKEAKIEAVEAGGTFKM